MAARLNNASLTEQELLKRVAEGDEAAFTELFNQYYPLLGAHIYRITESYETTAEVIQDVFLKIWINREVLSTVERFRPYLLVVSRNHALNCLKRLKTERLKAAQFRKDVLYMGEQPETPSYDTLLETAIRQLPPQQQKVYLYSRHERLSYQEISGIMGISPETVKKHLQAATASLSRILRKEIEKERMLCLIVAGLSIVQYGLT